MSNYHSQLCSLVPVPTANERLQADIAGIEKPVESREVKGGEIRVEYEDQINGSYSLRMTNNPGVSIGFKPSAKLGSKSVIWARTRGVGLDGNGEIKGGDSGEKGVIDVEFDDGLVKILEKAWPSHIAIEANNAHGVRVAKIVKQIVGRLVIESRSRLKMPVFVLKKVEVSELRAFSLSEQKKQKLDFVILIAYSMACYALDPLAECLKLRFASKEVPGLKNDLAVASYCLT